jgi:hypothetical protein
MDKKKLKKGWIFSNIEGVREEDEFSTYCLFDYDLLPPIRVDLDDEFNWLKNQPEYLNKEDWTFDFDNQLIKLIEEAKSKELLIPKSFINFLRKENLIRSIRSNTDCYFELGDFIEEIPNTGLHFIHFLSDSQYCGFWYLCLDKEGNHKVVTSGNLYGHKGEVYEEFRDVDDEIGYLCASSFSEFIYRFWVENEIWYKIYLKEKLNQVEQDYCNHYSSQLNKEVIPNIENIQLEVKKPWWKFW